MPAWLLSNTWHMWLPEGLPPIWFWNKKRWRCDGIIMKDSCISLSYSLWLVLIVVAKLLQNSPWIFVLLDQHTFPSTPFRQRCSTGTRHHALALVRAARRAFATRPTSTNPSHTIKNNILGTTVMQQGGRWQGTTMGAAPGRKLFNMVIFCINIYKFI
jgi:hypothetical protein